MFMIYFIHNVLNKAAITAIFRVLLLQEYKGTNVVSCATITL